MSGPKFPEIRTFSGLHAQANSFNVPDGAMEDAYNVYLPSDDIIAKIPGFYTYTQLDSGDTVKWMTKYRGVPVIFGADISGVAKVLTYPISLFVDDFNVVADGELADGADPGVVYGTAEQNKNLYFTGENGVFKIEEVVSPTVYEAGIPPALDISGIVGTANSGPLLPYTVTAYRYVFGRRDSNNNLSLGAPSDILYISMPPMGANATYTSSGGGPYTVVVSQPNHGLRTGEVISVSGGTSSAVDGTQTITVINANSFSFSVASNPGNGDLDYTFSRTPRIEIKIPSEINSQTLEYIFQVHRSSSSDASDAEPEPDFALIEERVITTDEINFGVIFFVDEVDQGFEGQELYTNPNSREGEAQANGRPPKAKDLVLYKNCMLYLNYETRHRLFAQLFDAPAGPVVLSGIGATEAYYPITSGYGNQSVRATASGTTTITVTTPAAHGYSTGWTVMVGDVTGTVPAFYFTIFVTGANTFQITSTGNTATALTVQAIDNGTDPIFWSDIASASIAAQIANTAQSLVRAINRMSASYYANYISTFSVSPGRIRIESKDFSDDPFVMSISGTNPFLNAMPATSTNDKYEDGIMVSKPGEPEAVPVGNSMRSGDPSQGILRGFLNRDSTVIVKEEGFYRLTGDIFRNFGITSIDSTFVPISRMSWASINNTLIGLTNQGLAMVTESSAQLISRRIDDLILPLVGYNESVAFDYNAAVSSEHSGLYYLTLWGEVGDSLVSRVVQPIRTIVYNVKNRTFSESGEILIAGTAVGSQLYIADQTRDGAVKKQHNFGNLADFTGEFRKIAATAVDADLISADITLSTVTSPPTYSLAIVPEVGDAIIYSSAISKIQEVTALGGNDYRVVFSTKTNIPVLGPVDAFLYKGYTSRFSMAPYHAGQVSLSKQFGQLQLHMRQPGVSKGIIEFSTCYFEGSEQTPWELGTVDEDSGGWGSGPWGLFPYGMQAGIGLAPGTISSSIVRVYIPRASQRGTYIKAKFTHAEACEAILIQALAYSARGYGERTSR
jgi:hypothetical protein